MQVSSASEFKDKSRKKIHELPSGLKIELVKIDHLKLMVALGFVSQENINNIGSMSEEQREILVQFIEGSSQKFMSDKQKQLEALEYIVMHGVSRPKVTNKALDEIADDEIHYTDFGDDLDHVVEAISDFSGFKNLAELAQR